MKMKIALLLSSLVLAAIPQAWAETAQETVLADYARQAKTADAAFKGFSAEAGKLLYFSTHSANAETPSCSTCHSDDPTKAGRSRAGKMIDPMAVSAMPERFSKMEKTEKWFGRNCPSVLGRDCTLQEKGDFITYLNGL